MPDASSADLAGLAREAAGAGARRAAEAVPLAARTRAAMILFGFIPLLHVTCVVAPIAARLLGRADRWAWGAALAVLYVMPPLAVRASTIVAPLPSGLVAMSGRGFLAWWFTAQWQVVFNRLPFLEEILRLVPGLYSAWLRLWGARVGSLVYWSPGVALVDRPLVNIGDRVVFGLGVRVNGHVVAPYGDAAVLAVAPITIGSNVLVGGYSLLLAGCEVAAGEATPPLRTIHPFTRVGGGRRTRIDPDTQGAAS